MTECFENWPGKQRHQDGNDGDDTQELDQGHASLLLGSKSGHDWIWPGLVRRSMPRVAGSLIKLTLAPEGKKRKLFVIRRPGPFETK